VKLRVLYALNSIADIFAQSKSVIKFCFAIQCAIDCHVACLPNPSHTAVAMTPTAAQRHDTAGSWVKPGQKIEKAYVIC